MNKKTLLVAVLAMGVLGTVGISQVSAYRGDYTEVGPNHTQEREDAMVKVMAEKDYEGWKELMTGDGRKPGVLRKVDSKEEFNQFAQAYELGKDGKVEEANAIRSELGLGNSNGGGNKGQNRGGNFTDANGDGQCDRTE